VRVLLALATGQRSFVNLDKAFRISDMNSTVCDFVHQQPVILTAALRKRCPFRFLHLCAGCYRYDQHHQEKFTNIRVKHHDI
jgi:hypothetical protein